MDKERTEEGRDLREVEKRRERVKRERESRMTCSVILQLTRN